MNPLAIPYRLPSGGSLPNRLAKVAMTEGLADARDDATPALARLYRRWSEGGAGLLIAGNVMVDRRYLERAGNVVLDAASDLVALRAWTAAGRAAGNALWVQLNHPGRQCTRFHTREPIAPSAVPLAVRGFFATPRALREGEIEELIEHYAAAAAVARAAGFTGVQVHAAHGYLISQFLSPRSNRRSDAWGGTLARRARFLLRVVAAVRGAIGSELALSVKLNASDFLHGGFEPSESLAVAGMLAEIGIDLLELSGGTYERIAFAGHDPRAAATREREVYFLEYASDLKRSLPQLPLMLSGGFRTPSSMRAALASGDVDVVGLARPFCSEPDFPRRLLAGSEAPLPVPERGLRLAAGPLGPNSPSATLRALHAQAATAWCYRQIERLARGDSVEQDAGVIAAWRALASYLGREVWRAGARRRRRARLGSVNLSR